jgi:phenylpropionate dioxygenase-like ring-hydroxylating dioxygenase large terminal subunit
MSDMLRNYWYVAAASREVKESPLGRTILGQRIVLFRGASNTVSALADVCPHRRAPLSMGHVVGDTIACPYHGIRFTGSGICKHIPTQDHIPPRLAARAYPVRERYGMIWIWLDDSPPTVEVPALPWREDPGWNSELVHSIHVRAPAELITNNLLDLSHVAFVHAQTIAFSQDRLAEDPLVVETFEDRVRCTRIFKDVEPPPAHRAWRNFKGRVDRSSISEWQPPGNVLILVRNEDADGAFDLRFDHFVTPETGTSHHYFVAISRNFLIDDTALTEKLDAENGKVHDEDREMVEAQHTTMLAFGDMHEFNLRQDQAIVRSKTIMRSLGKSVRAEPVG